MSSLIIACKLGMIGVRVEVGHLHSAVVVGVGNYSPSLAEYGHILATFHRLLPSECVCQLIQASQIPHATV